jgi:hypothetical protein
VPFQQAFPYIGLPTSGSKSVNSGTGTASGSGTAKTSGVSLLHGGAAEPPAAAGAVMPDAVMPDAVMPAPAAAGMTLLGAGALGAMALVWLRRRRTTGPVAAPLTAPLA